LLRSRPTPPSADPTAPPRAPASTREGPAEGSPLARLQPRSVAVFRALQLGDMMCAVPALRALRHAMPAARITLIGLPWAAEFARRFADYVDDFLPFPGFPGLPERELQVDSWPEFLTQAHARQFDLAIQLHGNGRLSNQVLRLLGARHDAGFAREPEGEFFLPYPDRGHEIQRLLRLAGFLGADASDTRLEFPLLADDAAPWREHPQVQALLQRAARGERYLCVHPGKRNPDCRWPAEHFAAVADAIVEATGLSVVISGSGEEAPLARAVASAMRHHAIEAAAPVPVGALAALVANARLLLANDTGPAHIADALGVPSVVIFRASDMTRWAPLDRKLHPAIWDPDGTKVDEARREALALLLGRAPQR
jgi:ADP-heptose:LPS heptosyltransferase